MGRAGSRIQGSRAGIRDPGYGIREPGSGFYPGSANTGMQWNVISDGPWFLWNHVKKKRISFKADFFFLLWKEKTRILLLFFFLMRRIWGEKKEKIKGFGSKIWCGMSQISDPETGNRDPDPGSGIRVPGSGSGYRDPDPRSGILIRVPQSWYAKKKLSLMTLFCWEPRYVGIWQKCRIYFRTGTEISFLHEGCELSWLPKNA
jgi:hypothetical protein